MPARLYRQYWLPLPAYPSELPVCCLFVITYALSNQSFGIIGSTVRHQIQVNDTARLRLLPLFAPAQNADH